MFIYINLVLILTVVKIHKNLYVEMVAGFHQCRWGYRNVSMTKAVVENFRKAKIPLDTMWNDIDYMDKYKDFTNDKERFPLEEWRAFVDELHANGQQYIIIIDLGKIIYDLNIYVLIIS